MLLLPAVAAAETAYVTDQFEITMRTGTSTQNAIVRMLPSGLRLEVLERDPESGYVRVTTPQGTEGWVLERYLMPEPAARSQLAAMEERLQEARTARRSAEEALRAVTTERDELARQLEQTEEASTDLAAELRQVREASAEVLSIQSQNRTLSTQVEELEAAVSRLETANRQLGSRATRDWFVAGAGVLLVGLVLGIVIPRIRWRRRSEW
jgi:SH3 domain protein